MASEEYERPKLEPIHEKWRLVEDWHTDCKGVLPGKITVPKGYVTDGASIPRFLWRLCGSPMDLPRVYAAIVHDWLYEYPHRVTVVNGGSSTTRTWDREESDKTYRDYQIALGISKIKAYTEYCALRMFAGGHWETEPK